MNSFPVKRVGYWWSEKKSRKFNVSEFASVCRASGLELVKIDLTRSLEEQGPFAAIVHKLSDAIAKAAKGDEESKAVCEAFQEYSNNHPDVVIIDPLPNVGNLLDRYRQYKLVDESELRGRKDIFIPAFVELTTQNVSENLAKMQAAGVEFPIVCKPISAHGSSAHQMSLIFNEEGLKDVSPPCVAQKFINHNAILYKLFIIGNQYFIIERPSLKNFSAGDQKTIFFDSDKISKPHSASALTELDDNEECAVVGWPD
ncbi:Inositol-tetrakisphosphate 1-kinase, partial [Stegodyphus mimosarum]